MAGIDSILKIVVQQGANELRVGSARPPRMFKSGAQKPLRIPEMSADDLRLVLGPALLSSEREALVRREGQVEFSYSSPDAGIFHVVITRRGLPPADEQQPVDLDVTFFHGPRGGGESEAPPPPQASPRRPSLEPPSPSGPASPFDGAAGFGIEAPTMAATSSAFGLPSQPLPITQPRLSPLAAAQAPAAASQWQQPSAHPSPAFEPGRELLRLLSAAVQLGASDVHLASNDRPFARVDGRLMPLTDAPLGELDELLGGALTDSARNQLAQGRSVDLGGHAQGAGRFRLNVYRAGGELCAALRLLPPGAPGLSDLNLPVPLDDLLDLPHGLVIVCGPTGSGKSSTLAALAQEALRRRSIVLVSLEDPIEHALVSRGRASLVRQRQIGRDVADFPTGLRDALREDPDVLLIGEMRDPESISLALTAAETGHLVLTSLHSRSAASAVERIIDTYPPGRQQQIRVQLADALRAVVAQRLLPRARGTGRVPALEVLRVGHAVGSMIREGKTAQIQTAIQAGRREGMITLERCLVDMIRSGQITAEAARAVANDPAALAG